MNSFSSFLLGSEKQKHVLTFLLLLWSVAGFSQLYTDVSLQASVSTPQVYLGADFSITYQVTNEGATNLTGLSVKLEPLAGAIYAAHVAPSGTSYDPVTGIWQIGNTMTANVASLELTIEAITWTEGVAFSQAQVFSLNEVDVDSEPGNDLFLEDDHTSACVSVPYRLCTAQGESVTLMAPPGLGGYEWYLDSGNGPMLVSTEAAFVATLPGSYSFSSNVDVCASGMCCPVILEEECENNQPPIANFDHENTPANVPVDIFVLDNDADPEGGIDTSSLTITDPPNNGTVTVNADGSLTYTPDLDFTGNDTLIYEICDTAMPPLCDTALVVIYMGELFFDLALEKSLAPGQNSSVDIGDDVTYLITVTNEGQFPAANIELADHIPTGMILSPNEPNWTLAPNGDAVFTLTQILQPGESASFEITLVVLYGASGQNILNIAEVIAATDEDGNPATDIDSTPNNGGDTTEDDADDQPIELVPHDPTGYIYCDKTGTIITGGTISVTGPGQVFIVADGTTGYYEFYTDGTPGVYTMNFNHPLGFPMSPDCLPQPGAFDPTGLPDPYVLGSDAMDMTLIDTTCAANPFYLQFDLQTGDPIIHNNNIPVRCCFIGSIVCLDEDGDEMPEPGEPGLPGITVSLFDCADTLNPIATVVTDSTGAFAFDGLPGGNYMLHFETPADHRFILNSGLDANGFSPCITLAPGECDTTTTACFYPCPMVDAGENLSLCLGDTAQLLATLPHGNGVFTWTPATGLSAADVPDPFVFAAGTTTYTVSYDDGLGCAAFDEVVVNVHTECLENIIEEDSVTISTNCDHGDPLFCFNVPYAELDQYSFELNGSPFEAEFGPCDYLKSRYYTYGALLGFGNNGPYRLEYWNVGGVMHSGEFNNMDELVALMNQWDPLGGWQHQPSSKSIVGGLRQTYYGKLHIRRQATGTIATLDLYELFQQNSSYLILPEGEHTLVVTAPSGAVDTVHILAACVTPEYVEISMPVGSLDTICLNTDEMEGGVVAVFDACLEGFDEPADLEVIDGSVCVEVLGMYVGQTNACYVICDELGICDTTYILINVYADGFVLHPDSLCTPKDVPITGEVLLNDEVPAEVVSLNISTPPQHGTVIVNPDNTVTYVPDEGYCNDEEDDGPLDWFVYEVCTNFDCQSTTVYVQVKCDGLIIYNGFSPNGDGVNDFFKIDGLENYESYKLWVFNRWGNQVFKSDGNYRNNWNGYWDDKKLPSGTYFYLLHIEDEDRWLSGYLQIRW